MQDSTPVPPKRRPGPKAKPFLPDDERHGTVNAYAAYGCRCDPCREAKANENEARAEKARQLLAVAKNRPCADCGGTFPIICMDFDHRDPSAKLFTIAQGLMRSHASLVAEIAKCDVVCSNCHRIRTAAQQAAGLLVNGRPRKPVGQPARRNRAKH